MAMTTSSRTEATLRDRPQPAGGIVLYVVIAYGLTWLGWIPAQVIAAQRGYLLPLAATYGQLAREGFRDGTHLFVSAAFSLAVYGPLAAALVVTARDGGRAGLNALLRRIVRWRISPRWYGIVALLAVALIAVPVGIGALTGMTPISGLRLMPLPYLWLTFVVQMVTSGLGEEPGWRGVLYPRLNAHLSTEKAIWTSGLLWAGWHLPIVVSQTVRQAASVPAAGIALMVLLALAGNVMSLVGMAYLYAWLIHRTDSLFLCILLHALSNLASGVVVSGLPMGLTMAMAAMPWALVFALERIVGKERFPVEAPEAS